MDNEIYEARVGFFSSRSVGPSRDPLRPDAALVANIAHEFRHGCGACADVALSESRPLTAVKRPDPPDQQWAGTCHNAPRPARHDRNDPSKKRGL